MTNQELQDKIKELKRILKNEMTDLEVKKNWFRDAELKIDALESQIIELENHLAKE